MKVNSITIKNFKGIEEMTHRFDAPVTALVGKVGTGKTSFIQSVRFGLTNETPTNPIRNEAMAANVILECDDDIIIEREIARPNKKFVKVMGRKTGTSASESFLEESTNVTSEIMKIVTSSEVLANLKPAQFAALFLNESVEKKTLDDLLSILIASSSKEKKAVMNGFEDEEKEGKLPPDVLSEIKTLFKGKTFNLDVINKSYEEAKSIRRSRNAQYKISSSKSKGFLEIVKPEYDERELNKKYEEIIGVEKNVAAYKTQVDSYNKAIENKREQDRRIAELDLAIAMNKSTEPDKKEYESLVQKRKEANDAIVSHSKVSQTLSDNREWFKRTLDQLEKPVCPISKKLICMTDKTGLKAELEEKIQEIDLSLAVVKDKIKMARERLREIESKISDYSKNKESFEKKKLLIAERNRLVAKPIKVPEEPEKLKLKSSYAKEKAEIKEKLAVLQEYRNAEIEYKETQKLKRLCQVSDFIVKSLDPKGPIIKEFIETFIGCLEDACNERAEALKPGFELKLVPEDGLKVLFKTSKEKDFLPYTNLSAGERIFAALILTDLINSFYDSRILILDDTDHLDAESFRLLMDFLEESGIEELYDNIIVSCVEHKDMVEVLDEYDVDLIRM